MTCVSGRKDISSRFGIENVWTLPKFKQRTVVTPEDTRSVYRNSNGKFSHHAFLNVPAGNFNQQFND